MIIGISGKSQSGKDLIGKICWNNLYSWQIKKFANSVNVCYEAITGINFHQLNPVDKELHRDKFRDFANKTKEVFGDDVWINALFSNYNDTERNQYILDGSDGIKFKQIGHSPESNWIITDTRFLNEAKAIKDRGGILIRVNRLAVDLNKIAILKTRRKSIAPIPYTPEHESETALDSYEHFDYVLNNNSTIDELIEQVKQILIKENLI